jgi:hypothetical protein
MEFQKGQTASRRLGGTIVQARIHAGLEAEDVVIVDRSGPSEFLCYFSVRLCYFPKNCRFYASFCRFCGSPAPFTEVYRHLRVGFIGAP